MRPGRGRPAAIAAAAAIATSSQSKRSHTPTSNAATPSSSSGTTSNTTTTTTTTQPITGNRIKQSVVRIEKVTKKDDPQKKIDEFVVEKKLTRRESTINKPITSETTKTTATTTTTTTSNISGNIARKRTATSTPTPSATPSPPVKRGRKQTLTPAVEEDNKMHAVDEDLSDYNLVTARARRTPKPNPKYARGDLVTNYAKSMKSLKSDEESDEHGDFVDSADDYELHSSDVKEDIGESDMDDLDDSGTTNKKSKRGGAYLLEQSQSGKRRLTTTGGRPTLHQKLTAELVNAASNRRKFGNTNNNNNNTNRNSSAMALNKRLNIEMYDASDSDVSVPSPNTSQRILKSVVKSANLESNRQTSLLRPLLKSIQSETPKNKPIQILERRKESLQHTTSLSTSTSSKSNVMNVKRPLPTIRNIDDDKIEIKSTQTASTVDDFETMPTFTIVNINDIINKKNDDILKLDTVKNDKLQQQQQQQQNRRRTIQTILSRKTGDSSPPPRSPFPIRKTSSSINNNITKSLLRSTGENVKISPPPRILNSVVGRKTRPVSPIVSPKNIRKFPTASSTITATATIVKKSSPATTSMNLPLKSTPLSTFRQRQLKENVSNTLSKTSAVTGSITKPIIMNKSPINSSNSSSSNIIAKPSPSSLPQQSSPASSSSSTPIGSLKKSTLTKKLPSDRVIVQRQGNKLVKKMTCYETWYVINVPSLDELTKSRLKNHQQTKSSITESTIFDMSIVELGNRIKDIKLPDNWTYKVTLQKLTPLQLTHPDLEIYTGDINDPNITDDDKIKYQPISIVFRRINNKQQTKQRMPFDRSAIFKNHSYILNIDGKNVRLCNGAPNKIKTINDITIILDILNELTLNSDFVEPTTVML